MDFYGPRQATLAISRNKVQVVDVKLQAAVSFAARKAHCSSYPEKGRRLIIGNLNLPNRGAMTAVRPRIFTT